MAVKYVFVTGGVVSGLGKGITAASLGRLLKARGYTVTMQKFDPYINIDPGTMSPYQHGEVYVTDDGAETDLDLGHYERFIDINLNKYSKLEQEYGHKEALARSFEKYKTEIQTLNSETEESIYLQTKLLEINLDAFKKNPADGMELAKSDSFLDKLFSNPDKKIEKVSSSPEQT